MKKIPSFKYYVMLGFYLAISEYQKKSKALEGMLEKLLDDDTLSFLILDLAYADGDKDMLDMALKKTDVIVFDEPDAVKKEIIKNEDNPISDSSKV
jgi:Mrp family chromosome partitioning ATPase